MASVDVRDIEVKRMLAKIRAEPERQEELEVVSDPVGEISEDEDIETGLGVGESRPREP
jgi:hypothetical protein